MLWIVYVLCVLYCAPKQLVPTMLDLKGIVPKMLDMKRIVSEIFINGTSACCSNQLVLTAVKVHE